MMLRRGMRLTNENVEKDLFVCHVSRCRRFAALLDLHGFDPKGNLSKPEPWRAEDVAVHVVRHKLKVDSFEYPTVMTRSDEWIREDMGKGNWLKKRDYRFSRIKTLIEPDTIDQYLYGKGLGAEVKALLRNERGYREKASFYCDLNRYIIFGCTKNSLLPFGLAQCGSNYRHVKDLSDKQIKRGPNGKNGKQKIRSEARCINEVDKENIRKTVAYIKAKKVNFSVSYAYELYHATYERYVMEKKTRAGYRRMQKPFPEHERISEGMFRYHFDQIFSKVELLRIKHGNVNFAKDFEDKQGEATDGVLGATYRYEIDATILNVYLRYPFDTTGRYTVGRPVLYLVVDVHSTMIVGMYLGLSGPNWQGVYQALANACTNKVAFAKRFGVHLNEGEWAAEHVPIQIAIDNGPEYKGSFLGRLLDARIGIEDVGLMAVYRGDAKGVVERKFDTVDNDVIKYLEGAVPTQPKREDPHASNNALYDYDSLVAILIAEICYHNNSADRLKKLGFQGVVDGVGITPNSIFKSSLAEMEKLNKLNQKVDEAKIRWALLPEERASVRSDAVYFKGVPYVHPYFKSSGSYSKARHHGTFDIIVKHMYDNINELLHETDDGRIVKLTLKNTNNAYVLAGHHWEFAVNHLEERKDIKHKHKQDVLEERAKRDTRIDAVTEQQKAERSLAPKSKRKSMQPGVKAKQQIQEQVIRIQNQQQLDEVFDIDSSEELVCHTSMDDLDDELYGD